MRRKESKDIIYFYWIVFYMRLMYIYL